MIRYFKRNISLWIIFFLVIYLWLNEKSEENPLFFDVINDLPNDQDTINFVESDALKPRLDQLTYCAIESATAANPGKHIHLFVTLKNPLIQRSDFPPFLRNLKSFSIHHIDLAGMVNSHFPEFTPEVQSKFHKRVGSLKEIARAILLFYKGGIHLEQDVVSVRPFPNVKPNFLPMAANQRVSNGLLKFEKFSPIVKLVLDLMPSRVGIHDWGNFGPIAFTDVMKKYCFPNFYDPTDLPEMDFFFQCPPNWNIEIPSINDNLIIHSLKRMKEVKFTPDQLDAFPDTFALHFNDVDGTLGSIEHNGELSSIMRAYCPQTYVDLISKRSKFD